MYDPNEFDEKASCDDLVEATWEDFLLAAVVLCVLVVAIISGWEFIFRGVFYG